MACAEATAGPDRRVGVEVGEVEPCRIDGAVGLQLGPYSGKVVADMIARGAAETGIGPFSLARFTRPS